MANFKTHLTVSSLVGASYGALGWTTLDLPLPTCALAGGLCGLSGILPDLDSDTGVPVREIVAFSAAVTPLLMIERFQAIGLTSESVILAGAIVYLLVRLVLATLLKRCTVHRGMFHSIPAALIAGLLAYLACQGNDPAVRLFKTLAVVAGYLSHLLLDEFYSLRWHRGRLRTKKSFGTAMKIYSSNLSSNSAAYGTLLLLAILALKDTTAVQKIAAEHSIQPPAIAGNSGETRWR